MDKFPGAKEAFPMWQIFDLQQYETETQQISILEKSI